MWTELFSSDPNRILQSFCDIMKTVNLSYQIQFTPDYLKDLFNKRSNTRVFSYSDGSYLIGLMTAIERRLPDTMQVVTAGLSKYVAMETAVQIINTKIRALVTEYGLKKMIAYIPEDPSFFLNDTLLMYQGGVNDMAVGAKMYNTTPRQKSGSPTITKRLDLQVEFF